MSEQKQAQLIVLKNVRVKYARIIKPGAAFDEGKPDQWSVNMYVTDEDFEKLTNAGCTPKEDRDNAPYFIARRSTKNKKNEDVKAPSVVNGRKEPFTEEVGNGSVCNIIVTPFAWEKAKRSGVMLYLNAVQVVNHVPMNNGVDAFDVVDDQVAAAGDNGSDLPF